MKQWPDRDVERPMGLFPQIPRQHEAVVGGEADIDLLTGVQTVETRDVAGVLEAAELVLQQVEIAERLGADTTGIALALAADVDREFGVHRLVAERVDLCSATHRSGWARSKSDCR